MRAFAVFMLEVNGFEVDQGNDWPMLNFMDVIRKSECL